jgi:GntR family transcriptional regulator
MDAKVIREPAALRRSSPQPLYRQIADRLERAIRGGALKPGDRLHSEDIQSRRFKVSRITVRQAIEELVRQGLIVRKQGKGTFVTAPAVRHDLRRLHGLLGSLFSQAQAPSSSLLRYELCNPPPDVARSLRLRAGRPGLALDRLYLIDDKPAALAQVWLVPQVAVLPRAMAELISTEDMMREVGIAIASAQVTIRAEAAGARIGKLLKISARAPILVLQRTAYGDDGAVKETGRFWVCSDGFEFVCSAQTESPAARMFGLRNVAERT